MAQAENLARLTAAQTPLMGGDNPELNPTDFAGIQPKVGLGFGPCVSDGGLIRMCMCVLWG